MEGVRNQAACAKTATAADRLAAGMGSFPSDSATRLSSRHASVGLREPFPRLLCGVRVRWIVTADA